MPGVYSELNADVNTNANVNENESKLNEPTRKRKFPRTCLQEPTVVHLQRHEQNSFADSSVLLEYSLHRVPLTFKHELPLILPAVSKIAFDNLIIISTFQKANSTLVEFTSEATDEKNRLLENFHDWAKEICLQLRGRGHFADIIDPCSGLPVFSEHGSSVYSEVDAASQLLRYRVELAGSCSITLHPIWGDACYPASIIVAGSLSVINEVIDNVCKRWSLSTSSTSASEHVKGDLEEKSFATVSD